jgi:uncharacterized protein
MDLTSSSETTSLGDEQRKTLLLVARDAVAYGIEHRRAMNVKAEDYVAELHPVRATFVTLRIEGDLRGCIGTCQPLRPLVEDVAHNAHAAAFMDPRFPPLSGGELDGLQIHISLLTVPEEMSFTSEEDFLAQVRPGVDGLLLEEGGRKGTLLPAVWEALPEVGIFVHQLKLKAGLPADYWSENVRVCRYTAESIE